MPSRATHFIEVRIRELNQLFNSMDPSPFYEKELDSDAEEFIVSWAKELPAQDDFTLVVHLDDVPAQLDAQSTISEAVHNFFSYRSELTKRKLEQLTRGGWKDLVRGLLFLGGCILIANMLDRYSNAPLLAIVEESAIIGGWVGMWRPLEIFLYERWPLREACKLFDKLSRIPVQVRQRT